MIYNVDAVQSSMLNMNYACDICHDYAVRQINKGIFYSGLP